MSKPTVEQSAGLQKIYDHFNEHLFDNQLSPAMLVLSRHKNVTGGYFSPSNWKNEDGKVLHEVGINSNVVAEGDLIKVYIILLHEMAHHWQWDHGKPSRTGYHNKEWGEKMVEIGLQPICNDTGEPKPALSGQSMSTELISGGPAETVIAEMTHELPWYADQQVMVDDDGMPVPVPPDTTGKGGKQPDRPKPRKSGRRTKYQCVICGLNAWAKSGATLICGDCNKVMIAQV